MRNDQRGDTQNEGQRRHDDRSQSFLGRFQRRLVDRCSGVMPFTRGFHDQDGILRGQADQHNETDLHEDVDIQMSHPQPDHGTQQAHRNHQQHGHRHRPAFVLCGQDQEDENDRSDKRIQCRITFLQLQVG